MIYEFVKCAGFVVKILPHAIESNSVGVIDVGEDIETIGIPQVHGLRGTCQ